MFGRRSHNLDLIPLDPDLERTFRRTHRAPVEREMVEMGDNLRNANQSDKIKQLRFEHQDVRAKNDEQVRAWNVDLTTSLGICSHQLRLVPTRV